MITENNFFNNSIVLSTQNVLITPLSGEHLEPLWVSAREKSLWLWTNSHVESFNDFSGYVAAAIREKEGRVAYPFVFQHRNDGCFFGSSRFGNISFEHKRAEIGWTWIAKQHQGTGVNREIKFAMIEFLFQTGLFHRVEFKTDALNLQSRSALAKIGAKEEGTLRSHMITQNGRTRDTVYFSILKDEWSDLKKQFEDFELQILIG